MESIYLALAALGGGILMALFGLWDSHESFDARKFGASVIRALFAGVGWAVKYQVTGALDATDLFLAFLSAAAFDEVVNRIGGAAGNPQFPLPASKNE